MFWLTKIKELNIIVCFQSLLEEHMNDSEKLAATGEPVLVWTKATKVHIKLLNTRDP